MDVFEKAEQEKCGRYKYREAELAYLLIDGERMFPLAELLASLFNNTARTTLFTRMEKIKTRRHFCSAQEIKLLKTVNGIHGSSAICTLIPEADVQKYCDVYIDRTVDIKLFSTSIRRSKNKNNISKIKGNNLSKGSSDSATRNDDSKPSSGSNVVSDKAVKPSKKARKACIKHGNKVTKVLKTSRKSNHSESLAKSNRREGIPGPKSLSALAKLALNSDQSLNRSSVTGKAKKKRKLNDLQDNDQTNSRQKKKAKNSNDLEDEEGFRALSGKEFKNDVSGNNTTHQVKHGCSPNKHPCGSTLSQCLTNANSEILFSDASSNDSGFASTTISETLKRQSSTCFGLKKKGNYVLKSTKARYQIQADLKASPSKHAEHGKCKRVNKTRSEPKKDKHVNKSLSPPALVLKRQNNIWQVETRTEEEGDASISKSAVKPSKAKKKLNWPLSKVECPNQQKISKAATCRKRKNNSFENDKILSMSLDWKQKKTGRKMRKVNEGNGNKSRLRDDDVNQEKTTHKAKKRFVSKTLKANKDFSFMNLFSSFPFLSVKDGDLCPSFSDVLLDHSNPPPSSHPIWSWQRGKPVYVTERRKPFCKLRSLSNA